MNLSGWTTISILLLSCGIVDAQGLDKAVIEVGENLPFKFVMTLHRKAGDVCSVKPPNKDQPYRLDPQTEGDISNKRIKYYKENSEMDCGVIVSGADAKWDPGEWSISISNTTGNYSEEFTVRVVVETTNRVPKTPVSVVEGENLFLRFEDQVVFNLSECRVNWTQREVVLVPGNNDDKLVTYWGAGLQSECGVRVSGIGIEDAGTWKLKADNSGQVTEGTFTVAVLKKSVPDETEQVFIARLPEKLKLGANNSIYCQAQRPTGEWGKLKVQSCIVDLAKVTKADEGRWTAKYAIPGLVEEMQTTVSVQVKELNYIHKSLKPSSRHAGGLDLLCRWTTYEFPSIQTSYCRFIRPDGVALSLQDGVGNADYSYHGDGINFSDSVKECGVTIHSPKQRDVGSWQCLIGTITLNIIKGGFIYVPSTTGADVTTSSQNKQPTLVRGGETEIVVQNQLPLVLGCQATAALNYCWFSHPNGNTLPVYSTTTTTISTMSTESSDPSYSYSGQGLDLGDCTITIKEASHNDTGKWSCNMGVSSSVDLKVLINVRVAEGNMATEVPTVGFADTDASIIKCHTIPKGVALEYCRFVRPDGVGFGFKKQTDVVLDHYSYAGDGLERGDCGLKIATVNNVDFGQWTCAALHVAQSVEGKVYITLEDQRVLSGGAVAGIVIGVVIAVVLLGVPALYLYRRHRSQYRY